MQFFQNMLYNFFSITTKNIMQTWTEKVIRFQVAKAHPKGVAQLLRNCFQFQSAVTYKSVAYKKSMYVRTIKGASTTLTSRTNDSSRIYTIHHWMNNLQQMQLHHHRERKFLSLPTKLGGLGKAIFAESCQVEYENSVELTEGLCSKSSIRHDNMNQIVNLGQLKMDFDQSESNKIQSSCKISELT